MKILGMVLLILVAIFVYSCTDRSFQKSIKEKVMSSNGQLVSIKEDMWRVHGPFSFWERSKHDRIYSFVYSVNGKTKTGWVKFNGLGIAKWKM